MKNSRNKKNIAVTEQSLTTAENFFNKGYNHFQAQDFEEALYNFNETIAIVPNDGLLYYYQGRVYAGLHNHQEALESYTRALKYGYSNDAIYNSIGLAYRKLDNPLEAIVCYDEAIKINKNCATAYVNKGIALIQLRNGNESVAIEEFDKALAIDSNYANALYSKGLALLTLNKTHEAEEYYRLAIKADPNDYVIYSNLGIVLTMLGKRQEAFEAFNTALHLEPDNVVAHIGIANLLGRYQEADDIYNQALPNLSPGDIICLANLVSVRDNTRFDDVTTCTNVEADIKHEDVTGFSNYCVIVPMPKIDYDNKLLNYPNLFDEASKYLGLYKAIDLSQQLHPATVTEILNSQDSELLLAGLMSLDN